MNVNSWLKTAQQKYPELARLDLELILAHALQKDRTFLHAHPETELTEAQKTIANQFTLRRQHQEPLAYLLGYKDFYGRTFRVTKDTLIPRPETEALITYIKTLATSFFGAQKAPLRILDLGTGSGCIAITLALELPSAQIIAADISAPALACTEYNIAQFSLTNISTIKSDLFQNIPDKFDIIVANLPYVDPAWSWLNHENLDYEPSTALYAADHGLALIKKLIRQAPAHLNQNSYLVLEADLSQHQAIIDYATVEQQSFINVAQNPQTLGLVLRRRQIA